MSVGLVFAPAPVMADEAVMLPSIEVSAQQPSPLKGPPPALETEVTAEELKSINAPNVSDAIKYQPNLNVRKRFIGDRNAMLSFRDMSSFQSPRALVLGDGLLLSNFLGASWDTAPRWNIMQPEEIDSIELIYGPYSAEYSGHALGGVVIMHSAMPKSFQAQLGAGAFLQHFDDYGTDGSYFGHKLNASFGDTIGRWSYFLAADRLENESQPMSFNVTNAQGGAPIGNPVTGAYSYPEGGYLYNSKGPIDMTNNLLKLKLGYNFTEDLQARLTLAYLDRNQTSLHPETYLRDAAGNPVYDGTVDIDGESYAVDSQRLGKSETQDLVYGLELEGALGGGWDVEAAASAYDVLNQSDRSSETDFAIAQANGPGTLAEDQGTGWWYFNLKLGHRHDGSWLGQRVLFGYHFDRYVLDEASYATSSWREATITSLLGDSEGKTRTHAVFVENEWWLGDAWTLVLGARQEWWRAYNGSFARDAGSTRMRADYPERSESRFSPKASLSYAPSADWRATLSLGVAYRFPTVGELYQGSLDNQGNFSAGFDPNLKPEHAFDKNLMIQRFFDQATLTLNLWENDVQDTIFRQTDVRTGTWSFQNIGRVRSRGVELVVATHGLWIDRLDLAFNVSYTHAEILENDAVPASEGSQFPRVPNWRVKLFANYRITDRLRLGGGLRYASDPYDTLDNSDGGASGFGYTDGYVVLDARASYRLGGGFTLAGGINNLTDERYYVYHPYPGRTFFADLTWRY